MKKSTLYTLSFVFLLLPWPGIAQERKANSLEFAYEYLAAEMQMPEICEKISPDAYLTAPLTRAGHQINYVKSMCYHNVAITTQQPELCKNVVPKNVEKVLSIGIKLNLDGSKINEEECRKEVAQSHGELNVGGGDYEYILTFLGVGEEYQIKQINESYKNNPERKARDIKLGVGYVFDSNTPYYNLRYTNEFREWMKYLPDFSQADPFALTKKYFDLGCGARNAYKWYCIYMDCYEASHADDYKKACIDVATFLKSYNNHVIRPGELKAFRQGKRGEANDRSIQVELQELKIDNYPELKEALQKGIDAVNNKTLPDYFEQ